MQDDMIKILEILDADYPIEQKEMAPFGIPRERGEQIHILIFESSTRPKTRQDVLDRIDTLFKLKIINFQEAISYAYIVGGSIKEMNLTNKMINNIKIIQNIAEKAFANHKKGR